MPTVIERQTIFTPLGIRFWDPATDRQIAHGLRVRAWPDGALEPVRGAFRTASGIYAFQGLPGLRAVEYPPANGGAASPPAAQRFVVAVEDEQRRFLPATLRVDAPFEGIYPTALPASPPGAALPGLYLFSAPWRSAAGLAAVRADLVRRSTGRAGCPRGAGAGGGGERRLARHRRPARQRGALLPDPPLSGHAGQLAPRPAGAAAGAAVAGDGPRALPAGAPGDAGRRGPA
ncbi:MAG: hypothetical protein V9H69_24885 [Anaerolineae bacterium]